MLSKREAKSVFVEARTDGRVEEYFASRSYSASVRMGLGQKLNYLVAVHIITLPVADTARRP